MDCKLKSSGWKVSFRFEMLSGKICLEMALFVCLVV